MTKVHAGHASLAALLSGLGTLATAIYQYLEGSGGGHSSTTSVLAAVGAVLASSGLAGWVKRETALAGPTALKVLSDVQAARADVTKAAAAIDASDPQLVDKVRAIIAAEAKAHPTDASAVEQLRADLVTAFPGLAGTLGKPGKNPGSLVQPG